MVKEAIILRKGNRHPTLTARQQLSKLPDKLLPLLLLLDAASKD